MEPDRAWLDRLTGAASRLAGAASLERPRTRFVLLALACIGFIAGIALSLEREDGLLLALDWRPLLPLVLVGAPLAIALHAVDYVLSARLAGRSVSFRSGCEIIILGAAASLLPLPGGTLTRIAGLKAAGASGRHSAVSTLLVTGVGLAVTFLLSGMALLLLGVPAPGAALLAFGAGGMVLGLAALLRLYRSGATCALILANKLLLFGVDTARIVWSLSAIGVPATPLEAAVFVVAGAVGILVFVFPSGLGIQEALSAAIAPLAGLAASAGFLGASVNRFGLLLLIAPLAAWLAWRNRAAASPRR